MRRAGLVAACGLLMGANVERDAYPTTMVPVELDAEMMGGARTRGLCRTLVEISPEGVPRSVQHEDCADVLARSVDAALLQWRWGTFDGRGMAPITVGISEPKEKFATTAPLVQGEWNDYRFKKWVDPPFMMVPQKDWGARTMTCLVAVAVASNGVPESSYVSNCGLTFQVQLAESLLKTRWPAHEHEGSLVWLSTKFVAPYSVALF